jgi:hypothetical protein
MDFKHLVNDILDIIDERIKFCHQQDDISQWFQGGADELRCLEMIIKSKMEEDNSSPKIVDVFTW